MEAQNLKSKIESAKKVALCCKEIVTFDQMYSVLLMATFVKECGKEVAVLYGEEPSEKVKAFFTKHDITLADQAKPLSYVISIDYGSTELEKVTYDTDQENGEIRFYITPKNGEFDFENVEYSTEGNGFDLTITFGVKSFNELGSLYEKSQYLFKDNQVISFARDINSLGNVFFKIEGKSTLIYIHRFLFDLLENDSLEVSAEGIIHTQNLLEGHAPNIAWKELGRIAERGIEIAPHLENVYYKQDSENMDLDAALMSTIQKDATSSTVWSKVAADKLKSLGIDATSLNLKKRIPFNTSSAYNIAFAVYEIEENKLKVAVESNDSAIFDAEKLAKVFGGGGNSYRATFTVDNLKLKDFEKRIFTVVDEMFKIKIEYKSEATDQSGLKRDDDGKSLTTRQGNDKNTLSTIDDRDSAER